MTVTADPPTTTEKPDVDTSSVSAALATFDPSGGTSSVVVGGQLVQFQEFARILAMSDLLPDGLKGKPANVFMALMQGLDLGLRPMQALNLIDVIKGKPAMNAQGMRAQILAAGHRYRIESTDALCRMWAHRKEWPDDEWPEVSFSIDQAKTAGLLGNDNWKKYPADMLLARATSRMAKAYFSDVTNGLSSVEELLDVAPAQASRSLAEVAAERRGPDAVDQPPAGSVDDTIVDAEVLDEPSDEEIRAAVLAQQGALDERCPGCGQTPVCDAATCPGAVDARD